MACTGCVVEEERLLGHDRLGVLDELDRLVRDVLGEVVALLGRARLIDHVVVVDEIRIPLIGLRAEEPVPPFEPSAARPVPPRRRQVHLIGGTQMPLAHHVRVPAGLAENLRQHPVLGRDRAARVGKADRRLGDARHAVARVIASCQQARTCRRAQRRGVPLRVANTGRRDPIDVRCLDRPAVAAHRRETDVVEDDVQDVRCAIGCPRRLERRPVGLRVADVDVDRALEHLRHATDSLSVARRTSRRPDVSAEPPRRPQGRHAPRTTKYCKRNGRCLEAEREVPAEREGRGTGGIRTPEPFGRPLSRRVQSSTLPPFRGTRVVAEVVRGCGSGGPSSSRRPVASGRRRAHGSRWRGRPRPGRTRGT